MSKSAANYQAGKARRDAGMYKPARRRKITLPSQGPTRDGIALPPKGSTWRLCHHCTPAIWVNSTNLALHYASLHPRIPSLPPDTDSNPPSNQRQTSTSLSITVKDFPTGTRNFSQIRAHLHKHHPRLRGDALSDLVRAIRDQLPRDFSTTRNPPRTKQKPKTKKHNTRKSNHKRARSVWTVSGGRVSPR
jgi:hypothetical protein